MRSRPTFIGVLVLLLALGGCSSHRRGRHHENEATASASDDAAWIAVQDVLRRQHLRLDRVDPTTGTITTLPEISQHWFEFWRKDVANFHDYCEATLNPIRRWVEVEVQRGDSGDWDAVSVVVHKQRLSAPDRQFNNSAAAYQFFGEMLPSTTGAPHVTSKDDRWIDLGRDPAMEDYLLRKITARSGLTAAAVTPDGLEAESEPGA